MRKVFLDTSAFYGFLYPKDSSHKICCEILYYLIQESFMLITHKWVEYETLSKLKKIGYRYCEAFLKLTQKLKLYNHEVTEELEEKALQIFWAYEDKDWNIIDCVSINVMNEENVYYAFSSDHHFEEAGLFPLIKYEKGKPKKTFSELY